MKPILIFMMGPTNVGKTTLMEQLKEAGGAGVGLVQVGNMMRAKYLDPVSPHYSPDHFKGQASPKHTQAEAWQMMLDGITACEKAFNQYVFIDGQPRDREQCDQSMKLDYPRFYVNLYAEEKVREARAKKRDAGNPVKLELSLARMKGDIPLLYELLNVLMCARESVFFYRTDEDKVPLAQLILAHLHTSMTAL